MGERKVDPKKQFSKKLASRTAWYWFGFMILVLAAIVYRPDAALYLFFIGVVVTIVMETSVLAYTHNSEYEKSLWAIIQTTKLKTNWEEAFKDKDDDEEESEG